MPTSRDAADAAAMAASDPATQPEAAVAERTVDVRERSRSLPSFGYLRGLDGVRGVALIMVLLIHAGNPWMHGGFFAVDVFFVLSGFLITSLLLQEHARSGAISLKDFWIRRSLRLFPAFGLYIAVLLTYVLVTATGAQRDRELEGLASAGTYVSNWVVALTGNRDMHTVLTGPTWSLSIEMQFYLLWPLVVVGVAAWLRWRGRPDGPALARGLLVVALVLAGVVMANRTLQAVGGADWWRTYGGTDTHSDGLLVGCALACIVALGGLRRWPAWLGWVGLAVLVLAVVRGWLLMPWTSQYGFAIVALAAAALIGSVAARQAISRPLGWAPFVFLGRISYGTYLWHFPVYLVFLLAANVWVLPWWRVLVAMAIAIGLGSASFYLVERPALRLKGRFEHSRGGKEAAAAQAGSVRHPVRP